MLPTEPNPGASAEPSSRARRPGYSESFPWPLRRLGGEAPIAYFDTGDPGGAAYPPLLLIHGLGGNFTNWEHLARELSPHRRVLGLDLPGCGDSFKLPLGPGGARYSIRLYADSCVRLLDALAVERAVFCGHSMGGQVVAEAALAHAGRVERLVLVDTNGFVRRPLYQRLGRHLVFHEPLVVGLLERFAVTLLHACFHDSRGNANAARFIAQADGRPAHPTLDEFATMACSLSPDLVERHYLDDLHRLTQPTLVLWGESDKLLPVAEVPAWVERLPAGRLEVVPECGHLSIVEKPKALARALLAFVNEGREERPRRAAV